jgi:flagellar biosynthesis anti-sigma factor FlgM
MKINPITNPNVLRSYQANKPELDRSKKEKKRDELSLSKEALSFSKALAEAKDAIEFRTTEEKAHIANIKQAVGQGQYKIDSDLIAARIVDELGL